MSHPTVQLALRETGGDRQRARDLIRGALLAQAAEAAALAGLSGNCRGDTQGGVSAGDHRCRNDGSTCICVCHDPQQEREARA